MKKNYNLPTQYYQVCRQTNTRQLFIISTSAHTMHHMEMYKLIESKILAHYKFPVEFFFLWALRVRLDLHSSSTPVFYCYKFGSWYFSNFETKDQQPHIHQCFLTKLRLCIFNRNLNLSLFSSLKSPPPPPLSGENTQRVAASVTVGLWYRFQYCRVDRLVWSAISQVIYQF